MSFVAETLKQAWPGPGGHLFSNLGQQGALFLSLTALTAGLGAAGVMAWGGLNAAWAGAEVAASTALEATVG